MKSTDNNRVQLSGNFQDNWEPWISASFVTDRHALLALALKMARQIELDGHSICSAELI